MEKKKLFYLAPLLIIAIGLLINFNLKMGMSDNWMGPYLSAASNYEIAGTFLTSPKQVNEFANLSYQDQLSYRFSKSEDAVYYNHNPIGYVILIWLSKFIFGWLVGDMQAIILLQLLVHCILSILIIRSFDNDLWKSLLFLVFYAVNPLIIYFAVFNFYYFWQVIPGVFILLLLLNKSLRDKPFFNVIAGFSMGILLLTRPTLILIIIFFFALLILNQRRRLLGVGSLLIAITLSILLYSPNQKSPWHTVYVGIGAYHNPYDISLSDNEAYEYYEDLTGVKVNASYGGNYYHKDLIKSYDYELKNFVLKAFQDNPGIFIKNFFLNLGQSFFVGYRTGASPFVNTALSLTGYFVIILSFFTLSRIKLVLLSAVFLYAFTYVLFYPPIQAYHYGAFILIVILLILNLRDATAYFKNRTV